MSKAEEKLDALAEEMKSMLILMEAFNRWRPEVDHCSTELSKDVKHLTSRIEALEATSTIAKPSAPSREEEGRAKGHGDDSTTQGLVPGALVLPPPLANGQYSGAPPHSMSMGDCSQYYFPHMPYHQHHQKDRLPKAVFPKFDGSNPNVWRENCEKYFNMYHIPMHLWAQFATIHFKGSAELWLQTYELKHNTLIMI